jgi:hypothetical protein
MTAASKGSSRSRKAISVTTRWHRISPPADEEDEDNMSLAKILLKELRSTDDNKLGESGK